MTKAELLQDRDEWKQQAESLQDELDALNEAYGELENINYDLVNNKAAIGIKDIENFKYHLRDEGLYNDQIEQFIDSYLRWYNN